MDLNDADGLASLMTAYCSILSAHSVLIVFVIQYNPSYGKNDDDVLDRRRMMNISYFGVDQDTTTEKAYTGHSTVVIPKTHEYIAMNNLKR